MTMTLSILNINSQKYNLIVDEDFVIVLTSKLITCFVDDFNSELNSTQLLMYWLEVHIYWVLDLEGEVHSIWDL